jgi:hypothetical protein
MGKTLMAVPAEAAMTKGFRFPTTPATATQEEAPDKMVRDYFRISLYAYIDMKVYREIDRIECESATSVLRQ